MIKQIGTPTQVVKVIDEVNLVINIGQNGGISEGQRFLVYSIGDEILDPNTEKSLGKLEIVKGTGKARHVQAKLSTISSDMKASPTRIIRRKISGSPMTSALASIMGGGQEIEERLPSEPTPFENPVVGDFVKKI